MQAESGTVRNISSIELEQAAYRLGISREMLLQVLGLNPDAAADWHEKGTRFDAKCCEWNQVLLFMRMFDSLRALLNDDQLAREWLLGRNKGLNARPIDLVLEGRLNAVVLYLEKFRFRA